jgi:hypothetical protein
MTKHTDLHTARAEKRTTSAIDQFNAGFASKAAKQRALADLNTAYNSLREIWHTEIIEAAPHTETMMAERGSYWSFNRVIQASSADLMFETMMAERGSYFEANDTPFDLHQVRDHHAPIFGAHWDKINMLRDLRESFKAQEIVAPVKTQTTVQKIEERVTESLEALMERRQAQFIDGCELHDIFKGLPVSVNAHWVHGHKGSVFIRRFYYMAGKLTPLNIICAVLDAKREEA